MRLFNYSRITTKLISSWPRYTLPATILPLLGGLHYAQPSSNPTTGRTGIRHWMSTGKQKMSKPFPLYWMSSFGLIRRTPPFITKRPTRCFLTTDMRMRWKRAIRLVPVSERPKPNNSHKIKFKSLRETRKTKNFKAIPCVLDELIRLNPENASFYHEKAYALFLDKRYEAALETCDTISARFGAAEDQYLTKHQIYMAQGNTDAAINELEQLIAKKPAESKAYILLAELYTKLDKAKQALDLLDKAANLFPNEPLVLLGTSDAPLAMGKQI